MAEDFSLGTVKVSLSPLARLEEYLRSRGMRMTQQRRLLLDYVFSRHEHFDADSLIERMPSSGGEGHVSRPTVYRTLNEFVDAGLLRRFQLGGRSMYEHDYGYPQHDHLHCLECQKLIEFKSDELLELRSHVARENRFHVTGHRLIISGICEDCHRGQRRAGRRAEVE
jgi:Fur family ferric uptake transcriptional regulator